MAPSHVPGDHHPLQGQNIYTNPGFDSLFPPVEQYGTSWAPGQLNHHQSSVTNTSSQSWHHTSFPQQPYSQIAQPYGSQTQSYQTASSSPYQYGQFSRHGPMNSYSPSSSVDPTLSIDPNAIRQQQQSPYQMPVRNATPQEQGTVASQAIQQEPSAIPSTQSTASSFQIPKSTSEIFARHATPTTYAKSVSNSEYDIPKGRKSGGFYVFDQAALAKATKSNALNKLVTFGSEHMHLAANRTILPTYTPRQSMKELKKAGTDNKKLLVKKSSTSLSPSKLMKAAKTAGSPSILQRDTSESDSYTESSDGDSDYSDDEEVEPSPLPTVRPDEPHEAVRYDIIKATWYPRKAQISSERIKTSMRELWEILNTIQKRWRGDSKAVTEAEEAKKTGELPVLKSRVSSQRDLLKSALKASLEFAHPDVLYHLGQVKPFLYLCYQFLANRFKAQDYNGPLSSVIYEVLVRCAGTLTTELLEETKVIKALNSMKKNANEENKRNIQQIIDGAALGSKKPKASSPPEVDTVELKNAKRPATQPAIRPTSEGPAIKKLKPSDIALSAGKKNGPAAPTATTANSTGTMPQKRPGEKVVHASAPVKARGNQVVNKTSTFFSSLNAASKKPAPSTGSSVGGKMNSQPKPAVSVGKDKKPAPVSTKPAFSFAETMAQLLKPKEEIKTPAKPEKHSPPETTEDKVKRLRKESRRHLRVSFRPDASLVSIRYFHHDPEEEMGHDENFVRDAGDIGGEGRMFKQHKDMDDDEDDEDLELEYHTWTEPSRIDFGTVDAEERKRNYAPYGGGECIPSCPEREANKRRENSTLLVFYTHSSDIPSSPREPLEQQIQSSSEAKIIEFGAPPEFVTKRSPHSPALLPAPDISNLESIFKQFAAPNTNSSQPITSQSAYAAPPPPTAPVADLASILTALQGQALPQPQPQPQPQVPQSQPPAFDLNAIMSAIQASGATGVLPPPPPGLPPFPIPLPPQQQTDGGLSYQTQHDHHANGGTKRQREDNNQNNEQGHNISKRQKGHKNHLSKGDRPHRVVECKFFKKGMCNKGDDCTFIHDLNM